MTSDPGLAKRVEELEAEVAKLKTTVNALAGIVLVHAKCLGLDTGLEE